MKKPEFRELDKDSEYPDEHMTWDNFMAAVKFGAYNDYDGDGELATETQVSDVSFTPSMIADPSYKRPEWATHVVWYNK